MKILGERRFRWRVGLAAAFLVPGCVLSPADVKNLSPGIDLPTVDGPGSGTGSTTSSGGSTANPGDGGAGGIGGEPGDLGLGGLGGSPGEP